MSCFSVKVQHGPATEHKVVPQKAKHVNYAVRGVVDTFIEFCHCTSLHGFNLIFQSFKDTPSPSLRRVQRTISFVIWSIVVLSGTVFGLYLIHLVWSRFESRPTITTVETNNYPIWNVPFPAVTICDVNVVYWPQTENITQKLEEKGFSEGEIREFWRNLATFVNFDHELYTGYKVFDELTELGYTIETLLEEVSQPCSSLIQACSWLGVPANCSFMFRRSKSSHGFCCSFNNHYVFPNTDESKVAVSTRSQKSPLIRVSGAGEAVGLRVLVNVDVDNYISARKPFYGVQVIIHEAESFPDLELTGTIAQINKEYLIAIRPSVIVAATDIQFLDVSRRACVYPDEIKLKLSDDYTYQACMTECRTESMWEKCGCVPFYYPLVYSKVQRRHCSLEDINCLSKYKRFFLSLEPPDDMQQYFDRKNIGMTCKCLQTCSNIEYDFQVTEMDRFSENNVTRYELVGAKGVSNLTVVNVYNLDTTCMKYRRGVFLSWDGLLATFGGIFGLCLGGSIISLVELIYFATFKLFAKIKLYKAKASTSKRVPGKRSTLESAIKSLFKTTNQSQNRY